MSDDRNDEDVPVETETGGAGQRGGDGNITVPPEDDVGYGKPPRKHQFKPGQSGNPNGRRKGSKGFKTELKEELNERVPITIDGKRRNISKRRLIIKALAAKAAKGNVAAADKLISLVIQFEGIEDQRTQVRPLSENDQAILNRWLDDADSPDSAEEPTPLGPDEDRSHPTSIEDSSDG